MKKVIILENFLLKMNKFEKIVKYFSEPSLDPKKNVKMIIKDMTDEEFEELKLQFEKAVANIDQHNQENHSILILNDLIEEFRKEISLNEK